MIDALCLFRVDTEKEISRFIHNRGNIVVTTMEEAIMEAPSKN